MSSEEREILRELWNGKLPCKFILSMEEIVTVEQPEPCYLLLPRVGFINQVTEKLWRHFNQYVKSESSSEMWFEHKSQPLKWHYPLGVLFDSLSPSLPWSIVVHCQHDSNIDILPCSGRDTLESHFIMSVKEADALKHRGQVMGNLQKREHKQLWLGLVNDKFDQFWAINRRLMERLSDDPFKHIPFKIYLPNLEIVQRLVSSVSDSGAVSTLLTLLEVSLAGTDYLDGLKTETYKVIIHGIEVPTDVPLQWLSEHFSYPDNFLHIVVTDSTKRSTSALIVN